MKLKDIETKFPIFIMWFELEEDIQPYCITIDNLKKLKEKDKKLLDKEIESIYIEEDGYIEVWIR